MLTGYDVQNTVMDDLPFIFGLFDESVIYQDRKGYPVWRNYDKNAIIKDVRNNNQYKIILESSIAIVFGVNYSDKLLWRELDEGQSIYLHRIVINPKFKGRKLFGLIMKWALDHIKQKGLSSIRIDTWAANSNIIDYYKGFGFETIENYTTPDSPDLPVHNRNLELALMEFKGPMDYKHDVGSISKRD